MLTSIYSALIPPSPLLYFDANEAAEKKNSYHIFTERHLQAMWLEQKYFKNLYTVDGNLIEIISPGIWNSEAGPDFLKAHVKIGEQELRGDIELHLSQEGWYHHLHHLNPNYNQVILHVSYWRPKKERVAINVEGKFILSTYLQSSLTIPEARIVKLIDLDLYPYKLFAGSGNCSKTLFSNLSKVKTTDLLRSAAFWRLKEKFERMKIKVEKPQNYLMAGIAMALGYKHNAEAFLSIYTYLSSIPLKNEQGILSLALALGGFYQKFFQKKWKHSQVYQKLFSEFKEKPDAPIISLKLDKIRPANHPVRRLAVLAKLMIDPEIQTLELKFLSLWNSSWNLQKKSQWKRLQNSFLALFPIYQDAYWEYHYTFENKEQVKPIVLMGSDLKREILINVCLPLLYTEVEKRGVESEKHAFVEFYSSIRGAKTKKSAYLTYRFFGHNRHLPSLSSADLQQGAYQIHRDFCIHFEASCQGCPFVERYKKAFN